MVLDYRLGQANVDILSPHSPKDRLVTELELKKLFLAERNKVSKSNGFISSNSEEWKQLYSFPRLFLTEGEDRGAFVLQPSLFHANGVPPVIYFDTKSSSNSRPPIGLPKSLRSHFRWKISCITPNTIRNCINFMRFDAIRPSNKAQTYYAGAWCKHMLTAEFKDLEPWKKVNHYPGSFHLGRKDKLWSRLKLAVERFGKEDFGIFHPTTFILPRDYVDLCEHWKESPSKLFIIKPPASARGNGIRVINDISQIPESALVDEGKKSSMIVQQYISNPCLLENGQKFDLRIYVLLTSVDPLRLYVYDEGLVRFASSKYSSQEDGIIDQYMHLTNYFINKKNQGYQINNDTESLLGCKWTLKSFWRYLRENRPEVNGDQLWETIIDRIVKTVISCEGPIARLSRNSCKNDYTAYELFGFDIILDENFKPWILEVNITPSLKSESDLDTQVKHRVIKDMFNLVGYHLPPAAEESHPSIHGFIGCSLFFDERLYTEELTRKDKVRQARLMKVYKDGVQCDNNSTVPAKGVESAQSGVNSDNQQRPCDEVWVDEDYDLIKAGILEDLTQNDIRVLMLAEDELSRCGNFRRVFPSPTSGKYLKYFDKPRYYDLLLHAWEQRQTDNRADGIACLTKSAAFLHQ